MFRTLIVEDNAVFRDTLIALLGDHFSSMTFEKASSSEEALNKLQQFPPELVFVDIQLPGINGLQLSKTVRSIYKNTVIIVLTNNDAPEYRHAASLCGANFFLSKGVSSVDDILDIVKTIVSGSEMSH